jgi:ABC-type antimicrobial peptide transport system permease subunit
MLSMLAIAAAMGLLLGSIGIYGVIAYSVSERTPEIAVRLALGATAKGLERMFLRQGLVLAGGGVIVGLAGAMAFTRAMSALLFGVGPLDPMTYGVVLSIVVATAMVATYVPARRATRGDPIQSLRG